MSTHQVPPQSPYSAPGWHQPAPAQQSNGLATAGFIVALIGAVLALIPFVGTVSWVISPVGLVLSIVGLVMASKRGGTGRGLSIAGVVLGVLGLILCIAYTVSFAKAVSDTPPLPTYSTPAYSAPSYSAPSTVSTADAAPVVDSFSDGTYSVGTGAGEIAPGRYHTTGSDPSAMVQYCAVIREKTDGSIIDLDNSTGGPMVVTVKSSDGQVKFQGDCVWTEK